MNRWSREILLRRDQKRDGERVSHAVIWEKSISGRKKKKITASVKTLRYAQLLQQRKEP